MSPESARSPNDGLVNVLRFHYHLNGVEWINMLLVWAFAHQLGLLPSAEPAQRGMPGRAHDRISLEIPRQ